MRAVNGIGLVGDDRHRSMRFDTLCNDRHLPLNIRDALWRHVLMRLDGCQKKTTPNATGAANMAAEQLVQRDYCFCDACCDDPVPPYLPTPTAGASVIAFLPIFPSYEWVPPATASAVAPTESDLAVEKAVHRYLVRMKRLPAPLQADMYKEHMRLVQGALMGLSTSQYCDLHGAVSGDAVSAKLAQMAGCAPDVRVLLLLACGHGRDDGALWLSDGTTLHAHGVSRVLSDAGFTGTVIYVCNMCHAEGQLGAGGAVVPPAGMGDDTPFAWVMLYSCGSEGQKASHALHVAKLLTRLIETRPVYTDLQRAVDQAWTELRDPQQSVRLWRTAPTVQFKRGVGMSGRFMDEMQKTVSE